MSLEELRKAYQSALASCDQARTDLEKAENAMNDAEEALRVAEAARRDARETLWKAFTSYIGDGS